MRAVLLALVLALASVTLLPHAAAESPCGPNVSRCEPFDPCRYNPHDPLKSPVQWVLCGDAENTVEYLLGGIQI
ncbi:MAG TPA: hypothetical protein VNX21_08115 [Candidatus Thermoplasmatota archaeon]|nr:hypothetical protein [Candidatus Thermoplasmatota archaeon]